MNPTPMTPVPSPDAPPDVLARPPRAAAATRLAGAGGLAFVVAVLAIPGGETATPAVAGLELIALPGLLLPFLMATADRIRRAAPDAPWGTAAVAAGAVGVAVKVATAGPGWIAREPGLDPAVRAALERINEVGFITFLPPLGIALAALGIGALAHGGIPRWLAWAALPVAAALVANGLLLDAEFGPAFLLLLAWVAACSLVLIRRPEG